MNMEDRVCQNQRIVKRRLMEAQGGAELRRLHIIYFLCRKGCNEQPHLIRIHHLSKNGVRLKDIKRWLGELRGKDLPESFAWSYKRRYKTGYVWQDLLDDDLVTPISDNEYVLKGSEISSTTDDTEFSDIFMQKDQSSSLRGSADDSQKASSKKSENQIHSSDTSMSVSPELSTGIEESSPTFGSEASTLTDDSGKDELEKNSGAVNQEASSSPFLSVPLLNKEKKRKKNKVEIINNESISSSSDKPHFRKSHSSGIFRNLITCGAVDTNDSALAMTSKRGRPFLNTCSSHSAVEVKDSAKEKREFGEHRAPHAAYKPLYGPKCSQCGKTFKPEKLHAHMKSCKGMKALAKGSNPAISAAENKSTTSTASRNKDSVSGYYLTR